MKGLPAPQRVAKHRHTPYFGAAGGTGLAAPAKGAGTGTGTGTGAGTAAGAGTPAGLGTAPDAAGAAPGITPVAGPLAASAGRSSTLPPVVTLLDCVLPR